MARQVLGTPGARSTHRVTEGLRPYVEPWLRREILESESISIDLMLMDVTPNPNVAAHRFVYLIRDALSEYASLEDVQRIRTIPNRLAFPPYARPESQTADWIRQQAWEILWEAVDHISARSGT